MVGMVVGVLVNSVFTAITSGNINFADPRTLTVLSWLSAHLFLWVPILTLVAVCTLCAYFAHRHQQNMAQAARHTSYGALGDLAAISRLQGDYKEAELLNRRALAIAEHQLGPTHPDTATILGDLAGLYQDQGKYKRAKPLYQRALAIREKMLGPEHPETAATLNNLARLYRAQGKYQQAEPLYQRALAIREKLSVGEKIAWVAAAITTPETFHMRARVATEELGAQCIPLLPSFFHKPPSSPEEAGDQFQGLGQWMAVCQAAIFEMLNYFREAALPLLRQVAFGEYDWTQARAIEVLCKFASEGIEREQIDRELAEVLPQLRYETVMSANNVLAQLTVVAPRLMVAFHTLIHEYMQEDPVDALDLIEALASADPPSASVYEAFLRRLMHGEMLAGRHPILDGQIIEQQPDGSEIVHGTPLPDDFHAIRAALVLLRLLPDDEMIVAEVHRWATSHPDEQVREELRQQLEQREQHT